MPAAKWNSDSGNVRMIQLDEFELWRDRGEDAPLIIRGEARLPEKPAGTVVICHGFKGFAHFSFFPYLAEKLAEAGFRAITFDFSGSGVGEDRETFTNRDAFTHNTYLQELDDLEAVIAEARVHEWIDDAYGLFGHSRGGGIAILQAARDQNVKVLVTWAAISSTNRWLPEVVADWRQSGYIPITIVHGSDDESVPLSEGERLSSLAGDSGEFLKLDGVNHSFGGKHPLVEKTPTLESVVRTTVAFFSKHLGH